MEQYEKEKHTLRENLIELESKLEQSQIIISERDQHIHMLESTINQLHREREIHQSEQQEKNLGGMIGGINSLSQLEAMLAFKEKEFDEYRGEMEQQVQDYKRQKDQLKGELEV